MSLKNKLEAIKKDVETKKVVEEITEGKESLRETSDNKQALTERITALKSLVKQVKDAYSSSQGSLDDFKKSAGNIKALYSEYEDYLKEKGINSVEEILRSDDFKEEAEVKEYHEAGASQVDESGKRGKLGKNVEEVAKAKTAVKEALPDMKLDFRGKKGEGEEMSPREASILKLENHVSELETELEEINKKESEKKGDILPKIKEMISLGIDKVIPSGNFSLAPKAGNLTFLDDKILELGGDELWPQIKETAKEQIEKTLEEKHPSLRIGGGDIDASLETEKLIYDAKKIKDEHQDLLELKKEEESLKTLGNEIKGDYFLERPGELVVKENRLYPADLIEKTDYFKEKNIEAKKISEEVINEYLSAYKAAKEKMPSGFFTGKKTKEGVEEMTALLDKTIAKMEEVKAPDNFYCQKTYEFTNKLLSIPPHFDIRTRKDWALEMKKDLIDLDIRLSEKVKDLLNKESDALNKLSNDLYNTTSNRPTTEMNGFNVPYQPLSDLYSYKALKNTEKVDAILKEVDGLKLSHEDFVKLFNEEREDLANQIASYPDSEKILNKLKELEDKFDNDYRYDFTLIQRKMAAKDGREVRDGNEKASLEVKKDLFNN